MTDTNKEREALLGFRLEKRADVWVVQYDAGGCHPATLTEEALWEALQTCRASLSAEAEPVAWVDERAIAWLANNRSRHAEITTKLSKEKSVERPMPIFAAPAQAPAPGWVSVPVEPTQAMLDAVVTTMDDALLGKEAEKQYREDWAAMIAAAPSSGKGW